MSTAASSDAVPHHLDLAPLLRRSWGLFAQEPLVHVLAALVVLVGSTVSVGILAGPLLVGYIQLIDKQARGESPSLSMVTDGLSRFGSAFAATLLYVVAILVGSVLVVLPGVIVAFLWSYALWFIALSDNGPVQALGAAWRLARHNVGMVLLLVLTVIVLGCLGGLVVVGTLVTLPLGLILMTLSFRELTP